MIHVYKNTNDAINGLNAREKNITNLVRVANCRTPGLISLVFYGRRYYYLPANQAHLIPQHFF